MKNTRLLSILLVLVMSLCMISVASAEADLPKVGYCISLMSHEWYQNIKKGAEARAAELGVELVLADGNNDSSTQITMCENLLAQGIDVLVVTPVDNQVLGSIIVQANELGVPVITESNVVEGAASYVGIDNELSGKLAGLWMGEYAAANGITPNVLVVGYPAAADCRMRVSGFLAGLEESGIEYTIAQEIDGKGLKDTVVERATDALTAHPDVNCIFGINDDSTTGAMQAYKAAGLDESKLTAIGFGFEGAVGQNALLSDGPYKSALAMFPNYVGVGLIDASVMAFKGEDLPEWYQTPTVMVTAENFDTYYNEVEDGYAIDFDAVRVLQDAL